eukprot:CAMPEP_0180564776 /NCGR_PEP_ID=MMETSP1037_2-20121125/5190_1 /TAXON_ID=632150 /ORGANISM="Azadinium spinosum, Strain 3D9" /LENGTH=637 /DNA_ID=CAMNT_0022581697 /DNA_START=38 /DNA_END=1951 /DNA_ORIENTATION=-
MITCCTDGTACVWEMKDNSYQILCFLSHLDTEGQVVKVNDAAAIILDTRKKRPSTSQGSQLDDLHIRVLTGGEDGCTRLWAFQQEKGDHRQWRAYADSEAEPYGIPQRQQFDARVYHECDKCMHHHAVLSLAVLPQKWSGQSEDITFNFISGTTAGYAAAVYSVSEADKKFEIKLLSSEVQMAHDKDTVVNHVAVNSDFLPKEHSGETTLVATCGGRGMAKLWRLSKFTDNSVDVQLLKTCRHTDEQGAPIMLKFVGFSPAWEDGVKQFFITSSYDEQRQERSRIFAWDLSEPGDLMSSPCRTYVFRASNFTFWYPRRNVKIASVMFIVSQADNSAKMFRLVNMETGVLTQPLLQDSPDADEETIDKARIDHSFMHQDSVSSVITVRKKANVDVHTGNMRGQAARGGNLADPDNSYNALTLFASGEELGQDDDPSEINWYFVSSSADKMANVWDPVSKQCIFSLRAATMSEMYLPLLMQVLTVTQLINFSFKQNVKWNEETIKPSRSICGIVTIDANAISDFLPLSAGQTFLVLVVFSTLMMLIFDLSLLRDIISIESNLMHQIEVSQAFRQEVKEGQTGLRGKPMGPNHIAHRNAQQKRAFLYTMINLGATVMVVPVFKTSIRFFDCAEQEDGTFH